MNGLGEQPIRDNEASRERWDLFRGHRARVTDLLQKAPVPPSSRLCVLGAGNCNDLDLETLLNVYREVHLVDLDADALARGVKRQGVGERPGISCHGGIDITGVLDTLARWSPQGPVPDEDLAACAEGPVRRVGPLLPGPFEVVASGCLLSQLIAFVVRAAGERHPRFLEAVQAIRAGHLRLLAELLAPGGSGFLVTDIVSSDTFPPLGSVPDGALPGVLAQLVQQRNFFHGVNPAVLVSFFRTDPVAAPQVADVDLARPWLWNFGPRIYAVVAVQFRKRATAAAAPTS